MQVVPATVPRTRSDLHDWIEAHWFPLLAGGAIALVLVGTLIQAVDNPWHVSSDSALFQHGGWYITQGATPYVDFWDLKPPLIYAVTTVLAVLSGGNMAVLHVLSVLAAIGAIAAGVTAVGVLNYRLTGDGLASVAAGWSVFAVTTLFTYPYAGIRPKYMTFCVGMVALLLAYDERWLASGAAAAVAAGFWHLGAPLAALVLAMSYYDGRRAGLLRAVGGAALVTALVLLPFVLTDNLVPLFVEVVLTPLYGAGEYPLASRLIEPIYEVGWGVLLFPIGMYGWFRAADGDWSRYWWVAVGGITYQVLFFVEMAGAIDAALAIPFAGLGVGALIADTPTPSRRTLLLGLVVLLVAGSYYWNADGTVTPIRDRIGEQQESWGEIDYGPLAAEPPGVPDMQTIYWEQLKPDTCHYRLDNKQRAFVFQTGGTLLEPTCGEWPFDQPPVPWIFDRVTPW
ncbi:DolP-mannose mannosyltransferase [Halorientalis halophila]|uniref:DolP-mannose mannosyltransferase n=1 Tax=Halorientalis halophila TaxID=3108499 RepID=UPI0030094468